MQISKRKRRSSKHGEGFIIALYYGDQTMTAFARTGIGWLLGIITTVAVTFAAGFVYCFIGLVAHAFSVCTEPTVWWAPGYYLLALALPVIGAWTGFRTGRAFIHRTVSTN
jgi:hypothetical protein